MYKFRKDNHSNWTCCPMGTNRGNGVIECYYFNIVTFDFCNNCEMRKDKKKIKK